MRKWVLPALLTLPLAVAGGLVYARSVQKDDKPQQVKAETYTCPITGEELPCPNCCPLNEKK